LFQKVDQKSEWIFFKVKNFFGSGGQGVEELGTVAISSVAMVEVWHGSWPPGPLVRATDVVVERSDDVADDGNRSDEREDADYDLVQS